MVLDEPTNHLDLEMRHALTVALQDFEGALIVVTHDRNLLRNTTNELLVVASGKVSAFDGDLDEYASWLTHFRNQESNDQSPNSATSNQPIDKKEARRFAADKRKKLNPLRTQLKKSENKMLKLQQRRTDLAQEMAEPSLYQEQNKEKLASLIQENTDNTLLLEEVETQWLTVGEELEELEHQLKQT